MNDSMIRASGLALAVCGFGAIAWVYSRQPQTFAEASGALSATIGVYRIDEQAFADGLRFFRADQFAAARLALDRADRAHQDPRTQFYIAYSYYREGWGRVYVDKDLYARGLTAVDRAIAAAPRGRVVVDDANLEMRSGDELKAELEAGVQASTEVNPLTIVRRHRK
ncbi:MAG TPA: hypothetical protein VKE51_19100 [Vicinamibacterales bacterium]|nr:hypothetical protein [Vicinamibacterales bacterium]